MDIAEQLEIIVRGAVGVISHEELKRKLERSVRGKRPLRIKLGVDPTAPDIHLGHTVVLKKLRDFQRLGHRAILIIGDYTAMIGDPSGRTATRPQLTRSEVLKNARTYKKQVFKILDPKHTKILFNGNWFSRFSFQDTINLCARFTVARMLERDDFEERYRNNNPISLREFLYPIMQAYDSVKVSADVEIGATDQTFNIMVGRRLQKDSNQEPQVGITMPMLEGTDGVQKMSKSLGNHIGIEEAPREIFGKIMSISDGMMLKYYQLLTDGEIDKIRKMHPMEAKKDLAEDMVTQYHGEKVAAEAKKHFEDTFQKRDPFTTLGLQELYLPPGGSTFWDYLKVLEGLPLPSKSEFRRKIKESAVRVNNEIVKDVNFTLEPDEEYQIQIGKKSFWKVIFRSRN